MKRLKLRKPYSKLEDRHPSRVAEPLPSAKAPARARKTSGRPARKGTAGLTRAQRYRKAAALIGEWMADDSGYDERVGALLEEELKKDPLRLREEFE